MAIGCCRQCGRGFPPYTDLLEPGETRVFTSPLYVVNIGGWPNGHEGTATVNAIDGCQS